jgi:YHS domain-containing protein
LLAFAIAIGASSAAHAIDPIYTGLFSDLAVGGYDPVAYFAEGIPVEGSGEYTHEWKGATWRFSSARNLELFQADPEKYAPEYGGYCAYAVANGVTAPGDPEVWRIVEGRLYLNVSESIQTEWERDIPGYIRSADSNWPRLLEGE